MARAAPVAGQEASGPEAPAGRRDLLARQWTPDGRLTGASSLAHGGRGANEAGDGGRRPSTKPMTSGNADACRPESLIHVVSVGIRTLTVSMRRPSLAAPSPDHPVGMMTAVEPRVRVFVAFGARGRGGDRRGWRPERGGSHPARPLPSAGSPG